MSFLCLGDIESSFVEFYPVRAVEGPCSFLRVLEADEAEPAGNAAVFCNLMTDHSSMFHEDII